MSQPRLGTHIAEVRLNEDNEVVRETLLDLFFDLDFTENSEEYREDTLSLGFKSEADRVVSELLEQDLEIEELIEACVDAQIDATSFYEDSNTIIQEAFSEKGNKVFIVFVAYMSEC